MIALTDLKDWLEVTTSEHDTLLTDLEEAAVDFIERETHRHFGTSETFQEHFNAVGEKALWLAEAPTALTTVEERQKVGDAWTAITEGDDDGWELRVRDTRSVVLRKGSSVWKAGYEYRITYEFGYAAGEEPDEIRQAVKWLVAHWYRERGREGLRTETIGDYSYSMMTSDVAFVPNWERVMSRWYGHQIA